MGNRLTWIGHVERMAEDRLTKRADAYREEGRRRRGRPRLRWDDCVKRDGRNAGINGKTVGEKLIRQKAMEDRSFDAIRPEILLA